MTTEGKHARRDAITRTLRDKPVAAPMLAVMANEGKTDGMGYVVEHVRPGRGFSSTEYACKKFPNGRQVSRMTCYPGPFDGLAGLGTEITEQHSVWVGWDRYDHDHHHLHAAPPLDLPAGATGWSDTASGAQNWFAEFGSDGEAAEAFALSLPPLSEDAPPFVRETPAALANGEGAQLGALVENTGAKNSGGKRGKVPGRGKKKGA